MTVVRRHWALLAAFPLLVLAVLLLLLQRGLDSRAAKAADAPLSASTQPQHQLQAQNQVALRTAMEARRHVQQLRAELALTTQDLAALGVSSATAEQILLAVKAFANTTPDPLAETTTAEQVAQQNLQEAIRKINVGPKDDALIASLSALQQSVATAQAQRAQVFSSLIAQVNGMLTSDQQAMWQAALTNVTAERTNPGLAGNHNVPGAFRYVTGLTDTQQQQLQTAARQGGGPGLLSAAPQILGGMQIAQAQTALANQRLAAAGVAVAERRVFPLPPGLHPVRPPTNPTTRPATPSLLQH